MLVFLNIAWAFTGGYVYKLLPLKGLWRVAFGVRRFRQLNITARRTIVRLSLFSLTTYGVEEAGSSRRAPRMARGIGTSGFRPRKGTAGIWGIG